MIHKYLSYSFGCIIVGAWIFEQFVIKCPKKNFTNLCVSIWLLPLEKLEQI